MCDGERQPPPKSFLKLALQPGVPAGERLRGIASNLGRRLRGGRFNDCCGRYGEPGC
jgi:hypothetical protein